MDLIENEAPNRFDNLFSAQTDIKRSGRAKIIDSLFDIAQQIRIEDKAIVYQAVSLMDRFYDQKNL